MNILVTGGAGFIGSNFVRYQQKMHPQDRVIVYDALTYAGNLANLKGLNYVLMRGNICDENAVKIAFESYQPDWVVHLAAESHVDRSIHNASKFLETNVLGTDVVLRVARESKVTRFVYVSTDEVLGDLPEGITPPNEQAMMHPSSPYAASKAAGEHLALAYHRTHGLPVCVVRPTNNYGPFQHPEKLIPMAMLRALAGEDIPIYGDGKQKREWLHVDDCCRAIDLVLRKGHPGEVYHVGSGERWTNVDVVAQIMTLCGSKSPMRYVVDRLGHDRSYAVNSDKIERMLGFVPEIKVQHGLARTFIWYQEHESWWRPILESGDYKGWVEKNYRDRK